MSRRTVLDLQQAIYARTHICNRDRLTEGKYHPVNQAIRICILPARIGDHRYHPIGISQRGLWDYLISCRRLVLDRIRPRRGIGQGGAADRTTRNLI